VKCVKVDIEGEYMASSLDIKMDPKRRYQTITCVIVLPSGARLMMYNFTVVQTSDELLLNLQSTENKSKTINPQNI